ncbi:DNA recombination protein RmuC [Spiroplasma sp. BIUS-1]|uniref:DNA recombination protein RmuC n=1 Tax=Spiroplasma sp. BIUS-1 TaxID=216964 RepID=UPI001398CBAA|nr:DNA recombination protein RmuC [Spiroplasma sp. BIUS-1]QHX36766.1 DNA recombination protein RmuC [Spiroplasma sp. BIUS-1]
METIIIVLLILLIVLVITMITIMLIKKNNIKVEGVDKKDLDLLQAQLSDLNNKSESQLKEYINNLNNTSNEKLNNFEKSLKEVIANNANKNIEDLSGLGNQVRTWIENQTKNTQDQLTTSNMEVRGLLNQVKEQSAPIFEVKEKVSKLDNLLSQNNKAGKAGEYLLERMLGNLTGTNKNNNLMYETQYKMNKKDGEKSLIVDLFIKGDGSKFVNIPVDAKFPFNAYQSLMDYEVTSDEFKKKSTEFKSDVLNRVKETSKYVSEEDKTVYAIMFVPSEGVFSYINSMPDIIEKAFNSKVIIAGPSTLIAIVQSIDKYMSLFENINQYDKKIDDLGKVIKFIENYDEEMVKLFETIEKLNKQYQNLKTKEKSLMKKYDKVSKG